MRILLASHGYPPELQGGTERSVRDLAHALAAAGHTVAVVAGSLRAADAEVEVTREHDGPGNAVDVLRLHRPDLHFDHWHKGHSPAVSARFRELCREFAPDVCHVHHWIRLSTDLVVSAAREGVPCAVTLHDAWTGCPIAFRVRPDTLAACEATVGPMPCVACASQVAPRTPWVATDQGFVRLAERQRDLELELRIARVLIAPSSAHAAAVVRHFGAIDDLDVRVVPPVRTALPAAVDRLAPPTEHGRLVVGAWGGLAPHKGTDLLIEAARRADVELHLAGAGDAAFEAHLRELARGARVTFHGPFEPADLPAHAVARVHLMVSGSRAAESYGFVCDEARDLGLPMLLPDAGAFAERAGRGAALYTAGDVDDLAAAFARFAAEPTRLGELRAELEGPTEGQTTALEAHLALYAQARERGAPDVAAEPWFEARMRAHAIEEWDRALERSEAEA